MTSLAPATPQERCGILWWKITAQNCCLYATRLFARNWWSCSTIQTFRYVSLDSFSYAHCIPSCLVLNWRRCLSTHSVSPAKCAAKTFKSRSCSATITAWYDTICLKHSCATWDCLTQTQQLLKSIVVECSGADAAVRSVSHAARPQALFFFHSFAALLGINVSAEYPNCAAAACWSATCWPIHLLTRALPCNTTSLMRYALVCSRPGYSAPIVLCISSLIISKLTFSQIDIAVVPTRRCRIVCGCRRYCGQPSSMAIVQVGLQIKLGA
jgi:hypothetical protein